MQKIRLKAVENSESKYNIALGIIVSEGPYYNATLALQDRNKPCYIARVLFAPEKASDCAENEIIGMRL